MTATTLMVLTAIAVGGYFCLRPFWRKFCQAYRARTEQEESNRMRESLEHTSARLLRFPQRYREAVDYCRAHQDDERIGSSLKHAAEHFAASRNKVRSGDAFNASLALQSAEFDLVRARSRHDDLVSDAESQEILNPAWRPTAKDAV